MLIFLKMTIISTVQDLVLITMTKRIHVLRQEKSQRGCNILGQKLRGSLKGTETLIKIP